MKVVVLLSGGLDSVTALHHMAATEKVVAALSFDYGAKHNSRELPCAADQCRSLRIPNRIVSLNFMAEAFKSDLLKSGGKIPDGHYEEESMKKPLSLFATASFYLLELVMPKVWGPRPSPLPLTRAITPSIRIAERISSNQWPKPWERERTLTSNSFAPSSPWIRPPSFGGVPI